MASRRPLEERDITRFLNDEDEGSHDGSDSEMEDHMSKDNIQSDVEDEYIDDLVEENVNDTPTPPENPRQDPRIIIPPHRVIRGKNRHVWATSKGQSSGRTSAINIVRSNRGHYKTYPLSKTKRKTLSTELSIPWMRTRLQIPTLSRRLRESIENILPQTIQETSQDTDEEPPAKIRRYCSLCTAKIKRMSKMTCCKCKKTVCGEHKKDVCNKCI